MSNALNDEYWLYSFLGINKVYLSILYNMSFEGEPFWIGVEGYLNVFICQIRKNKKELRGCRKKKLFKQS